MFCTHDLFYGLHDEIFAIVDFLMGLAVVFPAVLGDVVVVVVDGDAVRAIVALAEGDVPAVVCNCVSVVLVVPPSL